jgi:excinuclease ABC subunit C
VLAAVAEPVAAGADADRVAEDAVEVEEAPVGAAAPARPVRGAAAGDTAEVGRVRPAAGSTA